MSEQAKPQSQNQTGLDQIQEIFQRARQGDQSVVALLRKVLRANPTIADQCGDLCLQTQGSWIQLIAGPNLLLMESINHKLQAMRQELAGENPTALEKLLVERILACWLGVEHADAMLAQTHSAPPAHYDALQRRLGSAQTRYHRSIQALATYRRLMRPALSPVEVATRINRSSLPAVNRLDRQRVCVGVDN